MMNWVTPLGQPQYPAIVSEVETRSLAEELRTCLLNSGGGSKSTRIQELRKAVERRRNKAADTVAALLTHAFNSGRADPQAFAATITGFFSPRLKRLQRRLCDLMQVESIAEGEFEPLQMRIAQGDLSRPTLVAFKKELCEYRAILDEMELAVDAELYRTGGS